MLFLVLAVSAAAACARLGVWQLDRRHQRRAMNAVIAARMKAPPVAVNGLRGDTSVNRFRRVRIAGTPDTTHEFMLTFRGNNGSPGVDILTPVHVAGEDSAVLVNRGWIYSPDGMNADLSRWREVDTVFTGYIDSFESNTGVDSLRRNGIRRMDYTAVTRGIPYPVADYYLVAQADSGGDPETAGVVRLHPPKLDNGPHLNYALQWFAFATIALTGGGIVAARSMR